jgi:hypothetical protein
MFVSANLTTLSRPFRISSAEEVMILNEELRGMGREATVSYMERISQYFPEDSETLIHTVPGQESNLGPSERRLLRSTE